jgi:hypothetical protein
MHLSIVGGIFSNIYSFLPVAEDPVWPGMGMTRAVPCSGKNNPLEHGRIL